MKGEIPSFQLTILKQTKSIIIFEWNYEGEFDVFKVEKRYGLNQWETVYWGTKHTTKIAGLEENLCFTFRAIALERGENEYHAIATSNELKICTPPNIPTILSFRRAIQKHQNYILKSYVQAKPDLINQPGKGGATPVMVGVTFNNEDAVRLLLENGGLVNFGNPINCRTPLQKAMSMSNLKVVRALMERRPDFNAQDVIGLTAAHHAIDGGHFDALRFCLDNNSNVEIRDCCGWTLLMRAIVMQIGIEIVRLLIERGASVDVKDKNGLSAIELAEITGQKEVEELMKSQQIVKIEIV